MASITKLPNGRWRLRYRTPDGGSRMETFDKRIQAEQKRTAIEHDKLQGSYVDRSAGRIKLKDYAAQWRESQVHRATAAGVDSMLKLHIVPALGNRPIGDIRRSEVQAAVKRWSLSLAPSTVAITYNVLRSILRSAVLDQRITSSPAVDIKLPRGKGGEVVPMTAEQVYAVADAINPRYRALVVVAAATGLREGELLGLTVDRVNFLGRTVRVDRQMVSINGAPPFFAPPKTKASHRIIAAPTVALEALAEHLARHPAELSDAGLIFTNPAGNPITRSVIGHQWRRAAKRAGVAGYTFHDTRHVTASLLISRGASVKVVQHYLGHSSPATTLNVYAHLWPDDTELVRTALDEALTPKSQASRVTSV